jgi:hypothetical protein
MFSSSIRSCPCGVHYDAEEWDSLPMFGRLSFEGVRAIVTTWPAHVVVEVRFCMVCGRRLSRLAGAATPARLMVREGIAA